VKCNTDGINQGCPKGGHRDGCGPQRHNKQKSFFTQIRIRVENHLLNVLSLYMLKHAEPAVTIGTSLCNES